jgi:hypothetical protein
MSKNLPKTSAPARSPALALSRGLFGFRAGGAASAPAAHEKTPPPEGDGARSA